MHQFSIRSWFRHTFIAMYLDQINTVSHAACQMDKLFSNACLSLTVFSLAVFWGIFGVVIWHTCFVWGLGHAHYCGQTGIVGHRLGQSIVGLHWLVFHLTNSLMYIWVHLNSMNLNLVNWWLLQVNNSAFQLNPVGCYVFNFGIETHQTLIYLGNFLLIAYSIDFDLRRFFFHSVCVNSWWLIGLLRIELTVMGRVAHFPP